MARTRDIRRRIQSVRNIHKITRTMEKVAQSKGMKLATRFEHAKEFRRRVAALLPQALGAPLSAPEAAQELASHALGSVRGEPKKVLLFCVTSSRGLCGGYNARVIQAAIRRMEELRREGREALLAVMGRKGLAYFRYHGQPVLFPFPDVDENIPFPRIDEIASAISDAFMKKDYDVVQVISTRWRSRAAHDVRIEGLLPFATSRAIAAIGESPAPPTPGPDGLPLHLVEPDRRRVRDAVLPLLVRAELFCTVLEAMLCEQAQRSAAMRNASDNADSMTKRLTRTYNRARQAQITNEMIEIISGSEEGRT